MLLLSDLIVTLILNIIHQVFSLYLHLIYINCLLFRILDYVGKFLFNKSDKYKSVPLYIDENVKHYPKIPKHIVLVLGEEYVCYDSLVQFILWNLSAGVVVCSIYDHKNGINSEELIRRYFKHYPETFDAIKWGVSFLNNELNTSDNNFENSSSRINVNVFNYKYSRQLFIDAVNKLSEDQSLQLIDRKSTETALDTLLLSKMQYCGSPDLMIICGNVCTTYGFSPWHIGFTEFRMTPSYRLMVTQDFINILKSYAYCDQKFGR